jgi:hypothetical protein
MGIFSRKKQGQVARSADFDLGALRLPRNGTGVPDIEVTSGTMTVETYYSCDDMARTLVPMTPFLLSVQGEPTILVKLEGTSPAEAVALARAVEAGECLAVPAYRSYPMYPVFIVSLMVYDVPGDPMRFEGYRDVATADVQDFVMALGRSDGSGQVRLYDDAAELVAVGRFGLRIPPFQAPGFPYRVKPAELGQLWEIFDLAAGWYHQVPPERRDFSAAVRQHISTEPVL